MLRAIIIDDEKTSCDALSGLIKRYCDNITVVAQADGYKSGIKAIHEYKPDIVFLDIQMPDGSGFQVLEDVKEVDFEVIFTTAYDQYAIKAIKYSALDYLLKPIIPSDLVNALQKAEHKRNASEMSSNIKVLLENLKTKTTSKKIILSTSEKIHVVETDNIIRCESDDYYTRFFFSDGKTLLISKTLKETEQLLGELDFLRPHKSHLVNIKYIKGFLKNDGGYIQLSDGSKVPVSRRKKEKVIHTIQNL
ncbi:MAG TPA: LytTR family DNA-binding domain-containing protein [Bacteroidales bacterium]|nr:LytTR family DNA-binding domain-containing protein [Bacteroidales bacterium]